MKEHVTYALYRGDELVDIGTANELAKRRGVKPDSIRFLATPSYIKRMRSERRVIAIRV